MSKLTIRLGLLTAIAAAAAFAQSPSIFVIGPNYATGGVAQTVRIFGSTMTGTTTEVCYSPTGTIPPSSLPTLCAGAVSLTGLSISASDITGTVPAQASGQTFGVIFVRATTPGFGQVSSSRSFFIDPSGGRPTLGSISPTSLVVGSGFNPITGTGTNFSGNSFTTLQFIEPGSSPTSVASGGTATTVSGTVSPSEFNRVRTVFSFVNVVSTLTLNTGFLPFNVLPPSLSSPLVPNSRIQNTGPFSLTVNGAFETPGSDSDVPAVIHFLKPGSVTPVALTELTHNAAQMVVTVQNTEMDTAGTATVFARYSNGGVPTDTASLPFTIVPPSPLLTGASPNPVAQNSPTTAFTLSGSNLAPVVSLTFTPPGGAANSLTPTSANATTIVVNVPGALLTALGTGTFNLTTTGGSTSTTTVIATPAITSVTPNTALRGAPNTNIAVAGTNLGVGGTPVVQFRPPGSAVYTDLAPVVGPTLAATIPAGLLTTAGSAFVRVRSGTAFSADSPFTIIAPAITLVNPPSGLQNSFNLSITLTGTNFTAGGLPTVTFTPPGGSPTQLFQTAPAGPTSITAFVDQFLLTNTGTATIQVQTGTALSNIVNFTIGAGPVITNLNPNSAVINAPNVNVQITGSNFTAGGPPQVRWNLGEGSAILTIVGTPTANLINAIIPTSLLDFVGTTDIKVRTGSSESPGAIFTINPAPVLNFVSPFDLFTGTPNPTITLFGSNFLAGGTPIVSFTPPGGVAVNLTLSGSPTADQVSAIVPTGLLTTAGLASVVLRTGGVATAPRNINILASPVISSIVPTSATAGGPSFLLTVNGSNFTTSQNFFAQIRFNTTLLQSNVSPNQITATISAALIQNPGAFPVTVEMIENVGLQPAARIGSRNTQLPQVGPISNTFTFNVFGPPSGISLSPTRAPVGSGFNLTINGTGFRAGDTVDFNSTTLTPATIAANVITVAVPPSAMTTTGIKNVRVLNNLGSPSNTAQFIADYVVTSLNPTFTTQSTGAFPLTVTATTPISGGTNISFNGTPLAPTSVAGNTVTTTVPANLILSPAIVPVSLIDGPVLSNSQNFTILGPINITTLSPTFVQASNPDLVLTVNGSGFDSGTQVFVSNIGTVTTFVNSTQVTAIIPGTFLSTAGTRDIFARDSRGRQSNTVGLPVLAQIQISSLVPNNRDAGLPAFTLTVNGTGFETVDTVSFNGTNLTTTFVNVNQLTATVPANLTTVAGGFNVAVFDNRNRTSAPQIFTVNPNGSLLSLSPTFVEAGSGAFTLTLNGQNFVAGMNVLFGEASIPATLVNANQATALIPANFVTTPTQLQVRLVYPSTVQTNALRFDVLVPLRLTQVAPVRANAGIGGFILNVLGQGFTNGAVVRFGAANLATTFVSANNLTAIVPAPVLGAPGAVEVRVQNPDGRLSGPVPFTILPAIRITSVSPSSVQTGAQTFNIAVTGDGFTEETVIRAGGINLATTFISQTQVTAIVIDSLVAGSGNLDVIAINPLNAVSNAVNISVAGAGGALSITSVSPTGAQANGPAVPIIVTGAGFTNQAVVRFNGLEIPTTFISSAQLNATIPADLLRTVGTFPIGVSIGAQSSNSVNFQVGNQPEITFLNPNAITAGARAFTLIVLGRGFVRGATIKFGDTELASAFSAESQISAPIGADLIARERVVPVVVVNPDGQASNSMNFRVVNLTLTAIDPGKATVGGAPFTLSLEGTGFINGASVSFGGTGLVTTFGSATRVSAQVPTSALQLAGEINVTVSNPDGAVSNALKFVIEADTPSITRLNPNSVLAGSGEVTVNVIGGGFVRGSSVSANGNGVQTTFNGPTSLDAVIPAELTRTFGRVLIKVTNPGGKESNESGLAVTAPTPSITSINPPSANAGSTASVAITITGAGFIEASSVRFNGSGIETSFNSPTSLSAVIPVSALATAGNFQIQVSNPGDLLSNAVQFQVLAPISVTAVNPATIVGGNANVTITVNGTGFVNGASVVLGANSLATTFVSATQLTAIVPPAQQATAGNFNVSVRNPNGSVSNSVALRIDAPIPPPALNLQVPATITPAGDGRVQVTLDAGAPVALTGTLTLSFNNNSNNAPAGYLDPALVFASTANRQIGFTIAQGATNAVIPGNGAFSPGTVAGTIVVTISALAGSGQNLLPNPAPARNIVIDRSAPAAVVGSVRISNITGGFQVEVSGVSSVRDLSRITYTFTTSGGVGILEGQTVAVDVTALFNTYFASDTGRAAGGTFKFTMPFTVSGGDASAVTSVSVTLTNSVGTSAAVTGGR